MKVFDGHLLRLTPAESRALIALYRHRRRDASAEKALTQAVATLDGWMAGLVLLLEEATGPSTTLAGHEQSRQAIFSFLGAEVFARMDVRTQEVLCSTAYCPVVTGAMATELSRHRDAESCLETLYRRRYFVERRDGTPTSYTYHPLLQEFLRHRLQQDWPTERLLALCAKTAHLLAAAGQVEAAVDLSMRLWLRPSFHMRQVSCGRAALGLSSDGSTPSHRSGVRAIRGLCIGRPVPPRRSMRPCLSRSAHNKSRPIACFKPETN
jgi:ATP/maltotriose-dependent transcriptional regulator MalT